LLVHFSLKIPFINLGTGRLNHCGEELTNGAITYKMTPVQLLSPRARSDSAGKIVKLPGML